MKQNLILLIHCPDRPGLVASVTALIGRLEGNIVDLDQHVDAEQGVFFMRVEWTPPADPHILEQFGREFAAAVALPYEMHWRLHEAGRRLRLAVFVSRYSHCLYDILARWQAGEWNVEIPLVVSNHGDLEHIARAYGVRFEHVPVTRQTKTDAEQRQLGLLSEERVDLVVPARSSRRTWSLSATGTRSTTWCARAAT
jgi:formyltetrahydrofolate deformylase